MSSAGSLKPIDPLEIEFPEETWERHTLPYRMTVEEYFDFRTRSEAAGLPWKYEFLRGEVVAMAGGTPTHNSVGGNVFQTVANSLEAGGDKCRAFNSDQAVAICDDAHLFPDVSVACGEPEYNEAGELTNPVVLFEVLSPSTEGRDRGAKFHAYFALPSVQDYVLISQDQPRVEVLSRGEDGSGVAAVTRVYSGLDADVVVPSLNLSLSLARVYRLITLESEGGDGV